MEELMRSFRKAHSAAPSVAAGTGPGPATTPPAPEPPAATETGAMATEARQEKALRNVLGVLRLALGWVFLWAFLDKMFALGYATGVDPETGAVDRFGDAAWINGGSPTEGFLSFATAGPLAGFYQSFAGAAWADWLFMLGLLGIGLALMLGVAMRITAACGALLSVLMWTAVLPPANNPLIDEHIIYALVFVALALAGAGYTLGIGKQYERLQVVAKHAWLR
jgi:thiosulfate dehydrogenase (quinone) large subunit